MAMTEPSRLIPPGEPFPEEIHMRLVCGIVWCIDASDDEAEKIRKVRDAVEYIDKRAKAS